MMRHDLLRLHASDSIKASCSSPLQLRHAKANRRIVCWLTYKLVETPLLPFTGDIKDHIAGEDRVWYIEDLPLKASEGCTVPAHIHHNALNKLRKQAATMLSDLTQV